MLLHSELTWVPPGIVVVMIISVINDDHEQNEHIQIVPLLCRDALRLKIRIPQMKQNRSETDQRLQCKVY